MRAEAAREPDATCIRVNSIFDVHGHLVELDRVILPEAEWEASIYARSAGWQVMRHSCLVFAFRLLC